MAIQERKGKHGISWRVYWNDPKTKKRKSRTFHSYKQALRFDDSSKMAIEDYRKTHPTIITTSHLKLTPITPCDGLEQLKERCQKLYQDPRNRIADIFDFVMDTIGLPIRFREVSITAKTTKRDRLPAKLRALVLARDNYRCRMCGATSKESKLHVDHIIPISRGGMTEERNLQTLCEKCNLGKRDFGVLSSDTY